MRVSSRQCRGDGRLVAKLYEKRQQRIKRMESKNKTDTLRRLMMSHEVKELNRLY